MAMPDKPNKKHQIIQIGVYQQGSWLQFVWLNRHKQVQFVSFSQNEIALNEKLMARLMQDFPQTRLQLRIIGCISPHLTWSKTLILPHVLNSQECEQQCHFVLQKELPIALDELWFDYVSTPLKQGFRLDIHAIRKEVALDCQQAYRDISLNVLDVMNHAILRAFRIVLPEAHENALYLYQDETHCFAIMESAHQQQVLQTTENLTALYDQFCRRFEPNIEQIYVYQTPHVEQPNLPEDWQRVETDLPFIALGNALWQTDLNQNAPDFSTVLLTASSSEKNNHERH